MWHLPCNRKSQSVFAKPINCRPHNSNRRVTTSSWPDAVISKWIPTIGWFPMRWRRTGTNGCDASMRCNKPTRNSAKPTNLLADDAREHILQLAKDFPQVWQDPRTAPIERKRLVALLIDDVTLINAGEVTVQVRFRGGRTQSFTLPRPLPMSRIRKTPDAVVQTLDRLLETCTEREAAMRLNGLGHRNWRGQAFTEKKCHWYGEPMDRKVDMNVCAPTGY